MSSKPTRDVIDGLKAEHGTVIWMGRFGVIVRLPTLAELTAAAKGEGIADKAIKKLATACIVWPQPPKMKAGELISIAIQVIAVSGKAGPVSVLEEHELTDELAEVMVKWEADMPHALHFENETTEANFTLVCREPNATELDSLLKNQADATKMRDMIRTLTVFPVQIDGFLDTAPIEARAPGLFSMIAGVLAERAGLTADVEMGKL